MENDGGNGSQVPNSPGALKSQLRTVKTASGNTTIAFSHDYKQSDGTGPSFNSAREGLLTNTTTQPTFHPPPPATGRSRRGSKASRKSTDKFSIKHKISVRLRPRSAVPSGPSRKISGSSSGLLPPGSTSPRQHLKPGFLSRPITPVNLPSAPPVEPPSASPFHTAASKGLEEDSTPPTVSPPPQDQQQSRPKQPIPHFSSNRQTSYRSSSSKSASSCTPPCRSKSADNISTPFTAPPGPRLIPQTQSPPPRSIASSTISADADEAWRGLRRKEFTLRIQEEVLKAGRRRLQADREELERERRDFKEERRRWWRERVGSKGRIGVAEKRMEAENAGETDRTSWSETESSEYGSGVSEELGTGNEEGPRARAESFRSQSESDTTYSSTASVSGSSWSRRPTATNDNHSDKGAKNDSTAKSSLPPTSTPFLNCAASKPPQQPPRNQPHTYATYTQAWTALSPSSASIPFPTSTLLSDDLLLFPFPSSTPAATAVWPTETLIKHNAANFILAGHTIPSVLASLFDPLSPPPQTYIAPATLYALSNKQLGTLVSALRRELRRWHEDSLARRVGTDVDHGCAGTKREKAKASDATNHRPDKNRNDALVADERVRTVFRAFTELRDEVLAEVRAREETEVRMKGKQRNKAEDTGSDADRRSSRGPSRESEWRDWMRQCEGGGKGAGGIRSEDFI